MKYSNVILAIAILISSNLSYADSLGQYLDDVKVSLSKVTSLTEGDLTADKQPITSPTELNRFFNSGTPKEVSCKKDILKFIVHKARSIEGSPAIEASINNSNRARPQGKINLEIRLFALGDTLTPIVFSSISPIQASLFGFRHSHFDPQNRSQVWNNDIRMYDAALEQKISRGPVNSCDALAILKDHPYEQYQSPLYNNGFGSEAFAQTMQGLLGDTNIEYSDVAPTTEVIGAPVMN